MKSYSDWKIEETSLKGVKKIIPSTFQDHRGSYTETYNKEFMTENKIEIDFLQDDISISEFSNSRAIPTLIDNILLTISKDGYFFIIDKTNGNILRSTYILNNKNNKDLYPTGFITAKNYIYVSLSNGKLLEVAIEDGKTKNVIKIDGDKISRPYILNKKMYILRNNAILKIE